MNGINAISAISGIDGISGIDSGNKITKKENTGISFKSMLEGLIENANQADKDDKAANLELLSGNLDNLHDVIIAGEEADLALRLTIQIKNKAMDAYSEIIKMSV